MPEKGSIITLIDNLTLLTLLFTVAILLIKKCWKDKLLMCILINATYSIFLFIMGFCFPMDSSEYDLISNLTIHVDTLSGFGFFYYLWDDSRFRRYLLLSVIPVLAIWLFTLFWKGVAKTPYWNLMLPSIWYLVAAQYGMVLLYKKSNFQESIQYISRFLLIAGFLFYNFIYLVIETCYVFFTSVSNVNDAWNINYWGYFIFRLLMLGGVLAWYFTPRQAAASIAINK